MDRRQGQSVSRQKVWLTFVGILVLGMFFGGIVAPKLPGWVPFVSWFNEKYIHLGLDLQGGAHLVYEADVSQIPVADQQDAIEGVRDVIERRVNALGVSEPLVQTNMVGDRYRVIVELAGIFDINEAIAQIGETPLLEFKEQAAVTTESVELTDEERQQIDESEIEALRKAQETLERVQGGEDFATVATELSEDPTAADNAGDLGFVSRGVFVPEFDVVLFDELQDGELASEPVKTQFGYHIIQRLESRLTDVEGEQVEEVHGRHILLRALSPLDFTGQEPWNNTALSGKHLESARVVFDQTIGVPQVSLNFNEEGGELFAELTKKNLGKPLAIFLDGEAISIPVVQSEITNGEAVITGDFTIEEAKLLAQRLQAGALPVPIQLVSQLQIGPSLGQASVEQSVSAGLWGLILVMIFMVLVYRLPGLLADISLLLYTVVLVGIFELVPVTLTLAGIAGFLLSIGMAVDANVLIYERTKEELRRGRPLLLAVEDGFSRAWSSIRDSNISSLITAAILVWFGTSIIQGFALTLSLGIIVSMFSAITITRTFLRLIAKTKLGNYSILFGAKPIREKELE